MTDVTLPRTELASKIVEACKGLVAITAQKAVDDACQTLSGASSNVRNLMYDQAYYEVRDNMVADLVADENLPDTQLQAYEIACKSDDGRQNTVQHLGLPGIAATHQGAAYQRILNQFN